MNFTGQNPSWNAALVSYWYFTPISSTDITRWYTPTEKQTRETAKCPKRLSQVVLLLTTLLHNPWMVSAVVLVFGIEIKTTHNVVATNSTKTYFKRVRVERGNPNNGQQQQQQSSSLHRGYLKSLVGSSRRFWSFPFGLESNASACIISIRLH